MSLTRREAFFAAALTAWTVPILARAQSGALGSWTPRALTQAQAATLSAACETILPATDTPGAIGAGAPQFIDRWLAEYLAAPDAERLCEGLADLDARAKALGAASFAELSPLQRATVANAVEAEAQARRPHYWSALRDLTTTAYFSSEVGATRALRYDPVPGAYHGCVPLKTLGRAWATA